MCKRPLSAEEWKQIERAWETREPTASICKRFSGIFGTRIVRKRVRTRAAKCGWESNNTLTGKKR